VTREVVCEWCNQTGCHRGP